MKRKIYCLIICFSIVAASLFARDPYAYTMKLSIIAADNCELLSETIEDYEDIFFLAKDDSGYLRVYSFSTDNRVYREIDLVNTAEDYMDFVSSSKDYHEQDWPSSYRMKPWKGGKGFYEVKFFTFMATLNIRKPEEDIVLVTAPDGNKHILKFYRNFTEDEYKRLHRIFF